MTHPFDEIAVEASAKAAWNEESIRAAGKPRSVLWSDISVQEQQKWLDISRAALSAAFKSARDRGMVEEGNLQSGMDYLIYNEPLEGTTYPVTIIHHKENEHEVS